MCDLKTGTGATGALIGGTGYLALKGCADFCTTRSITRGLDSRALRQNARRYQRKGKHDD